MAPQRIALLGASHWHAGFHAEAAFAAGATLAAVWDPDPAAAARLKAGPAVGSLAAALDTGPDLVIALGRGPDVPGRIEAALARGLPVLADKPIGLAAADLAPLVQRPGWVTVALPHRLGPLPARVAELRAAGRLGPVRAMWFGLINGPPQRYRDWGVGWMLERAQSGGGALRNLGLHGVDAFLALAGPQAVRVEHAAFIAGATVEDYALVVLRADDGMLGVVEAGYTHADPAGSRFEWRIDAAGLSLADDGERCTETGPDGTIVHPSLPQGRRYAAFMADTLARLRADLPPLVPLTDFARAMAIVDAAYAAEHP
jgi:predicted dehydrogenase